MLYLTLLNAGANTHFCLGSVTPFALDLAFCSPRLSVHFEWSVLSDLHRSDCYSVNMHITTSHLE